MPDDERTRHVRRRADASAAQRDHPEQNQHQRDAELEHESQPRRNHQPKDDDRSADGEDRDAVADPPHRADGARRASSERSSLTIVVTATT